ncbi:hypothetical protein [Chitinophaga sancti]|uniref:Uncharacterized protein n=1 Tax=Chitinophaga sancti TaxID=1004 RepID=A0ABZ0XEG9_9BACT|nr:hypothetical protein [Chitinophaga sancti]WQD65346.1 hypothetical protein U0033_13170 [Chitinophaga sancti]WQG89030.1 hypothetical protein SR876_29300 [Chitinophaga sancti]
MDTLQGFKADIGAAFITGTNIESRLFIHCKTYILELWLSRTSMHLFYIIVQ